MYWSRSEIKTNNVRYEFNRPYLQHKELQTDDALAVEATSYALLTLFKVEGGGVTIVQVKQCETKNSQIMRKMPLFSKFGQPVSLISIFIFISLYLYLHRNTFSGLKSFAIRVKSTLGQHQQFQQNKKNIKLSISFSQSERKMHFSHLNCIDKNSIVLCPEYKYLSHLIINLILSRLIRTRSRSG